MITLQNKNYIKKFISNLVVIESEVIKTIFLGFFPHLHRRRLKAHLQRQGNHRILGCLNRLHPQPAIILLLLLLLLPFPFPLMNLLLFNRVEAYEVIRQRKSAGDAFLTPP